jgi:5-methylcytosine-specific restriction protein A
MGRLKAMAPRLAGLRPRVAAMPKVAEPFYTSRAWQKLRAMRMLDADYFAALKRAKQDGSSRVVLDHKRERKDGGADLDPRNTQWLTNTEHQAKTAAARKARGRGEVKTSQP